jgi:hypothetical protein
MGLGEVSWDNTGINAYLQVRDTSFNVQTTATSVQLQGVGNSALTTALNTVLSQTCTTSASSGQCLATLTVPTAWFGAVGGVIVVSYGIAGGAFYYLTTVVVLQQPTITVSSNVVLQLPQGPLFRGSSFYANIVGQAGYAISTFTLELAVGTGLTIGTVTAPAQWSMTTQAPNAQTLGITSLLQASTVVNGSDSTTAPVTLATVQFLVSATAPQGTTASVNCTVRALTDIKLNALYPRGLPLPVQATFFDRFGNTSTALGRVLILADAITGLLAASAQTEFVNTAVLTGLLQQSALTVQATWLHSGITTVTSALTCISSAPLVLQVVGTCAQVFLNGTETSGAASVTVTINAGAVNISVPFRVWFPQLPVSLQIADPTLNAVQGWQRHTSGCGPRYQSAAITARATFQYGPSPTQSVDVTSLVQGNFLSNATGVVQVSTTTGLAMGVSAGVASVLLVAGGSIRGSVAITVSNTPVAVTYLTTFVVSTLVMGSISATMPRLSSALAVVSVNSTLVAEFQTAYVSAAILYSDNMQETVILDDGLVLTSLNTNVVQVSQQTVIAVGGGNGLYLNAALTSGVCNSSAVITWSEASRNF